VQILKAAILYFALVFGAGFVLGIFRTSFVVPKIGGRRAELLEAPVMLIVTIISARRAVLRLPTPLVVFARIETGCIALALMLIAELALVRLVRGISIREYLATRDRVAGTVYYVMLAIFAVMPLLVSRRP
jgi:hypothetical protein